MIVLDENIIDSQRALLRHWRIHAQQIGFDIARKGLSDPDILPFLQHLSCPTLFTRDLGLCSRHFCHPRYGLVVLSVEQTQVAEFVCRVLRHSHFSRSRDRMGRVVNAFQAGLRSWTMHSTVEQKHLWLP